MIVFTNCSHCLNDLARHNNDAINCISLSGAGFRSRVSRGRRGTTECMTGQAALQTGHLLDGGLPTDDGYVHKGNTPSCSDTPITQWKHSKLKGQFTEKLKMHIFPLTCSAINPSGLFWCELLSFRDIDRESLLWIITSKKRHFYNCSISDNIDTDADISERLNEQSKLIKLANVIAT